MNFLLSKVELDRSGQNWSVLTHCCSVQSSLLFQMSIFPDKEAIMCLVYLFFQVICVPASEFCTDISGCAIYLCGIQRLYQNEIYSMVFPLGLN